MMSEHLKQLEAESIYIFREAAAQFERPVLLYSIGKDSSVLLHLALKAFAPGKLPFPLLHVDTTWKFKEMIQFRDQTAERLGLELIVHTNQEGLDQGIGPFSDGSRVHTDVMKTQALRQALVNLEAEDAPAGVMDVALSSGWPGILLHEAVGHGLEGDFNRKGTSAFSGRIGERVAAPGVTVVDDGSMAERRGSLSIDDEGTPTRETVLIEDGILKGYMQDRMNARLMGVPVTGNGRRESYAHIPMPRM